MPAKGNYSILFTLILLVASCSPFKQLDKRYLLNRNQVIIDKPELREAVKAIIKQKANGRISGLFVFILLPIYSMEIR